MALNNLFGSLGLDATLMKISQYLEQLASSLGRMYPDTSGNMRVNITAGTLPALTNQLQQSGYSTAYDQYAQMQVGAQGLRSHITVS